jgi:hypothetical protein
MKLVLVILNLIHSNLLSITYNLIKYYHTHLYVAEISCKGCMFQVELSLWWSDLRMHRLLILELGEI